MFGIRLLSLVFSVVNIIAYSLIGLLGYRLFRKKIR